jgi:hypothetical protein
VLCVCVLMSTAPAKSEFDVARLVLNEVLDREIVDVYTAITSRRFSVLGMCATNRPGLRAAHVADTLLLLQRLEGHRARDRGRTNWRGGANGRPDAARCQDSEVARRANILGHGNRRLRADGEGPLATRFHGMVGSAAGIRLGVRKLSLEQVLSRTMLSQLPLRSVARAGSEANASRCCHRFRCDRGRRRSAPS